jgi:NAD(P)-dependent dehydrogenase (short-subunit alcohol dehydrogenase family)
MSTDEQPFDVNGAVTVVTGATRGIGKQAALALGRAGATLVLVGRTRDEAPNPVLPGTLESVAAELAADGIDARCVQADLTDPDATQRLIDDTLAWFGRCDVLVNNAAYTSNGPILSVPWSRWQKAFRAQVVAPLQLVQAFVGGMLERGSGRVVNVSSDVASHLTPNLSLYSVTKQAMERFNDYLDLELGRGGVSFNVLHIDHIVMTEGWQHVRDTQGEEIATAGTGVANALSPELVGDQIAWMVRQPAVWSGHIVGCDDISALGGPA